MGMICSVTKFDFPAPQPELIARKVSEICGLHAHYTRNEHTLDDVHEFSGTLCFETVPEEKIELYAYRQGAIKRFNEELGMPDHGARIKTQGYSDADGVQRVYLDSYVGCELTLFHITELALLKLGGNSERPSDAPAEHDRILTIEELRARFQANKEIHRKNRPWYVLYGVFLVLCLPFQLVWTIVSMPFMLFRQRRKHPELFKKSGDGPGS